MPNKKETFKKLISLVFGVMIISLALGVWGMAFTEPSQEPPGENAPAPLNIGDTGQTKSGWLATLDSLWVGLEHPGGSYLGLMRVLNGALININGASLGLAVPEGKVGIGTQNPEGGFTMEVSGDIKLSDDPLIPGNQDFTITNIRSPINDSDVATKAYAEAKVVGNCTFGLRFAGYSGQSFHGNFGGVKGANQFCIDTYPQYNNDTNNVHWCSVKELMELGTRYPYSETAWVREAIKSVLYIPLFLQTWSIVSGAGATSTEATPDEASCEQYVSGVCGPSYHGPVILDASKGGRVGFGGCCSYYKFPCCYSGD